MEDMEDFKVNKDKYKMNKKSPLKYVNNSSNQTSSVGSIGDGGLSNPANRFTPVTSNGCKEMVEVNRPVFVLEKHMTVIRKGPTAPPQLEMFPYEEGRDTISTPSNSVNEAIISSEFRGYRMHNTDNWSGSFTRAGRAFDG